MASAATASSRARTPSSRPGPAPRRRGRPRRAVLPIELPAATGRRDGSGIPGPQAIAAVAGPVAVLLQDRAADAPADGLLTRVMCKADRMIARAAGLPSRTGPRRHPGPLRVQRRRRQEGLRGPEPRGGARAAAATTLNETSGVNLTLSTDGPPRRRLRHHQGRRGRHQRARRSRARSRSSSPGRASTSRSSPSTTWSTRRSRSRPAGRTSTPVTTAPRPGRADRPGHRLLLPARRHVRPRGGRERPRRRGQHARCSRPSPAPSRATR